MLGFTVSIYKAVLLKCPLSLLIVIGFESFNPTYAAKCQHALATWAIFTFYSTYRGIL